MSYTIRTAVLRISNSLIQACEVARVVVWKMRQRRARPSTTRAIVPEQPCLRGITMIAAKVGGSLLAPLRRRECNRERDRVRRGSHVFEIVHPDKRQLRWSSSGARIEGPAANYGVAAAVESSHLRVPRWGRRRAATVSLECALIELL